MTVSVLAPVPHFIIFGVPAGMLHREVIPSVVRDRP